MVSGPSTSLRRLNSWIPDIWLPTGRFSPITKGPTCHSSWRRSFSSLGTWRSQGEPAVLQEELVKTTALLNEAMGWWLLDWGWVTWEGIMPVRLPLCIFQSLRNEKLFNTSLLRWGQQCQKTPASHNVIISDTGEARVFPVCLLAFAQLVIIAIIFDEKPFIAILTLVTIAKTESSNCL